MFDRIGFKRIGFPTFVALIGATLVFTAVAAGQTTWYVDDDAPGDPGPGDPSISDPNENGSLEHPFDAIQEGIAAAVDGDEVVVADGTYTGYGNRDLDYGGKAITVRSENGPDNCIIDCEGSEANPHRGFYFHSDESTDSVVDGFTISNGYATDHGGGVYCYPASPTIANCEFTANQAEWHGGGAYCAGSTRVLDCRFSGNSAVYGGGVAAWEHVAIAGCVFTGNMASGWSGGVHLGGDVTVVACTFSENTADSCGGGFFIGNVIVRDCVFSWNVALGAAGLFCGEEATITSCLIADNGAEFEGGGIYCEGNTTISNCAILGNVASYSGGGIYCSAGSPTIVDCTVGGNWADSGAGVACVGGSPSLHNSIVCANVSVWYAAGLLCRDDANATVGNCVIMGNMRPSGSGGGGVCCQTSSNVTLANCILWANAGSGGPEIALSSQSTLTISYSDVEGGEAGAEVAPECTLNWGDGNIDADPGFVREPDPGPDGWWGTSDDDYGDLNVFGVSPCIDAGDNDGLPVWVSTGLDGRLRFADRLGTLDTGNPGAPGPPIVDMGAYEYQCTGDLDGDGEINLADLAELLAHYGITSDPAYADGDLDQDGDVDLSDLAALLSVYSTTCE